MNSLASARTLQELKSHYRRLAARHHPDKGGSGILMQTINVQYQDLQMRLKQAANDQAQQGAYREASYREASYREASYKDTPYNKASHKDEPHREEPYMEEPFADEAPSEDASIEDFSTLSSGETVYVNGTRCEVIDVGKYYFRVLACGRCRQAQICKTTGRGRFNPRLRASYSINNRAYYEAKTHQSSTQSQSGYKH